MIISLDPGITGTGIALWRGKTWKKEIDNPSWVGNIYPKEKQDFVQKTNSLLRKLNDIVELNHVTDLWCEMPEFFDDAGGHMAAKKGDLAKLLFFTGAVAGYCHIKGIRFHPVKPSEWKGQTTKEMVIDKIRHILPTIHDLNPKSHSYDAIGIGLWAQGFYKR